MSLSIAKRKLIKQIPLICVINQVGSRILPYTPQIAGEASFFQLPYLDHHFKITNLVRIILIF